MTIFYCDSCKNRIDPSDSDSGRLILSKTDGVPAEVHFCGTHYRIIEAAILRFMNVNVAVGKTETCNEDT